MIAVWVFTLKLFAFISTTCKECERIFMWMFHSAVEMFATDKHQCDVRDGVQRADFLAPSSTSFCLLQGWIGVASQIKMFVSTSLCPCSQSLVCDCEQMWLVLLAFLLFWRLITVISVISADKGVDREVWLVLVSVGVLLCLLWAWNTKDFNPQQSSVSAHRKLL